MDRSEHTSYYYYHRRVCVSATVYTNGQRYERIVYAYVQLARVCVRFATIINTTELIIL